MGLRVIEGRQVAGRRRSAYSQLDGEISLADECKCRIDWPEFTGSEVSFTITRRLDCPIDEHRRPVIEDDDWDEVVAVKSKRKEKERVCQAVRKKH